MSRGRELAKAVRREAERLGLDCEMGFTSKAQFADLRCGGQCRRVIFALTPSDTKAVIFTVSMVRRFAREMRA